MNTVSLVSGAAVLYLIFSPPDQNAVIVNMMILFFTALFIQACEWNPSGMGVVRRLLGTPILAFIGRVSYGVYLVHVLCKQVVIVILAKLEISADWLLLYVATAVASVGAAYALRLILEKPMVVFGRRMAIGHAGHRLPAASSLGR